MPGGGDWRTVFRTGNRHRYLMTEKCLTGLVDRFKAARVKDGKITDRYKGKRAG